MHVLYTTLCLSTQVDGVQVRCLYLKYYRDCNELKGTEWVTFGDAERKLGMNQGSIPRCLRDVKFGEGDFKMRKNTCDLPQRSGEIPEQIAGER